MFPTIARIVAAVMVLVGASNVLLAADLRLKKMYPDAPEEQGKPGFYIHAGPAGVVLSEGATMTLGGVPLAGATIKAEPQATFVVEAGYFLTKNVAISVTGGWPPRAQIHPAGTISNFGKLGIATYGPATLTAHYHFTGWGKFQPYIGAGPTFLLGLRNQDRLIKDLDLQASIGFAGQIGFDYMINRNWGFFIDVKKAYLRSKATGSIGGLPVAAKVKLDPLVVHSGVTYRF